MVGQEAKRRYWMKAALLLPFRIWLFATSRVRKSIRRLYFHAYLGNQLKTGLLKSVVVLGKIFVDGTGKVDIGESCFFYPEIHLETRGDAVITLGRDVVISRGAHLVAMSGITVGPGCLIGEYTSIRDANHKRVDGVTLRDSGHTAKRIAIGKEVWIGRGVTVVGGVTIGDGATVGANAVVTHDVPPNTTVAGVPAKPIQKATDA